MSSGASPWWELMDLKGLIAVIDVLGAIKRFRSTRTQDRRELWRRVGSAADHHGCVAVERAAERKFLGMCPVRPT
jgi:hypothetical protein